MHLNLIHFLTFQKSWNVAKTFLNFWNISVNAKLCIWIWSLSLTFQKSWNVAKTFQNVTKMVRFLRYSKRVLMHFGDVSFTIVDFYHLAYVLTLSYISNMSGPCSDLLACRLGEAALLMCVLFHSASRSTPGSMVW